METKMMVLIAAAVVIIIGIIIAVVMSSKKPAALPKFKEFVALANTATGCTGKDHSPSDGKCNEQCTPITGPGSFYRSDLGGCVANSEGYCYKPTTKACAGDWFKSQCATPCKSASN